MDHGYSPRPGLCWGPATCWAILWRHLPFLRLSFPLCKVGIPAVAVLG